MGTSPGLPALVGNEVVDCSTFAFITWTCGPLCFAGCRMFLLSHRVHFQVSCSVALEPTCALLFPERFILSMCRIVLGHCLAAHADWGHGKCSDMKNATCVAFYVFHLPKMVRVWGPSSYGSVTLTLAFSEAACDARPGSLAESWLS